jgi:hypothetical protein
MLRLHEYLHIFPRRKKRGVMCVYSLYIYFTVPSNITIKTQFELMEKNKYMKKRRKKSSVGTSQMFCDSTYLMNELNMKYHKSYEFRSAGKTRSWEDRHIKQFATRKEIFYANRKKLCKTHT